MYKHASMPFHTLASVLVWYIAWDDLGAISAVAKLQSIEVMQLVLTCEHKSVPVCLWHCHLNVCQIDYTKNVW